MVTMEEKIMENVKKTKGKNQMKEKRNKETGAVHGKIILCFFLIRGRCPRGRIAEACSLDRGSVVLW